MEIVRANEAHQVKGSATVVATEYQTKDSDINVARVEIRGRFPETGTMRNNAVKEIVYVERGHGTVTINGVATLIEVGDVILYDKKEQVVWNGELNLIVACTPAWSPSQHELIQ
jgi:mannose-6-phosphate isomerase-like protein (cupin superfamily)